MISYLLYLTKKTMNNSLLLNSESGDLCVDCQDESFEKMSVQRRLALYEAIRRRYGANIVPVIVIGRGGKFLVPSEMKFGLFGLEVRQRLRATETLFLMTRSGSLPPTSMSMGQIAEKHRDDDDHFLYIVAMTENVFGARVSLVK